MCGFNGAIGKINQKLIDSISKNSFLIEHRGPDEYSNFQNSNIYIDFFRLSIIDLPKGSQPKESENGKLTLFFNGEIYNFVELKEKLIKKGYIFNSDSDTEVLLNIFDSYGIEGVSLLNGMYSICLINNHENKTYLIRDQFGIKPLYYLKNEDAIYFSSETKTLVQNDTKFNKESIGQYLNYQFYLNNHTPYENIFSVDPGTYIEINNLNLEFKIVQYFKINFLKNLNKKTTIIELEKEIINSVQLQTFANVSVGAHLSGGIDSSLICAIAKMYKPDLEIFHGFFPDDNKKYSELNYAKSVAEHLNLNLHEVEIYYTDFIKHFSEIIKYLDYPIVGPGVFPQFMVNKYASSYVKVLLGGQGGDEIFAGYARYLIVYLEQVIKGSINQSQDTNHLVSLDTISKSLPVLKNYIPLIKKIWSVDLFDEPSNRYELLLNRNFPDDWISDKFIHYKENAKKSFIKKFEENQELSLINQMLHFDIKFILPGLLQVEDRMSMANSIESRVPFLDQNVFICSQNLEPNLKFGDGVLKYPLKQIAKKYLPQNVVERKEKMGFPVPFTEWLKIEEFKDFVFSTILESEFFNSDYIDNSKLNLKTLKVQDFDRSLWGLLCISEWANKKQIYN